MRLSKIISFKYVLDKAKEIETNHIINETASSEDRIHNFLFDNTDSYYLIEEECSILDEYIFFHFANKKEGWYGTLTYDFDLELFFDFCYPLKEEVKNIKHNDTKVKVTKYENNLWKLEIKGDASIFSKPLSDLAGVSDAKTIISLNS